MSLEPAIVTGRIDHCCHSGSANVDFVVYLEQDWSLADNESEMILYVLVSGLVAIKRNSPPRSPVPLARGVVSRSSCVDCVNVCCRSGELTSRWLFLLASTAGDDL